jgi:S-adenosylmethionine hydrolase
MDISRVGPAVPIETCRLSAIPEPHIAGNQLVGRITSRDHFGNLRSNISVNEIGKLPGKGEIVLQAGGMTISGLNTTYAEKNPGELIALIDSSGFLEIAVVGGNAVIATKIGLGGTINLSRQGPH